MVLAFSVLLCVCSIVAASGGAEWPFDVTTLIASDGSITAKFVSLGATMTELWVKDRFGKPRDVVLGYDDNTKLLTDPAHPYFNAIVGRYANRIKNGTFSIPISKNPPPDGPNVYHITTNDHDGLDTLHGGTIGWDRRNWTIVEMTPTSVTYKHLDTADEGFPGNVTAFVTHSVENGAILRTTMRVSATEQTPIMTAQHTYLNLDAFQDSSETILNHTLQIDGDRVVATDSILVPTGDFIDVEGTAYDFRAAQEIGARWNETIGYCGPNCQGYDNCWTYTRNNGNSSRVSLWSKLSGIRLDISTNQPAVQVYTSNMLNVPRKFVHGGPSLNYSTWSSVAIEQQGYIDAINNPEWGVDQIYGPGKDFDWSSTYQFSVIH